ncbi:MAG: beta-N-acetylhexosaminidase [Anaerolineales bacterium]|nr:beta-N-acetylhexosaminidase [Anaerolineales bacterium]
MPPQADTPPLIPLPTHLELRAGTFALTAATVLTADAANLPNAHYLQTFLGSPTGFPFPIQEKPPEHLPIIRLQTGGNAHLGREGYTLTITPHTLTLTAPTPTGVFYGLQTLRQLLPPEIERRAPVPNPSWQIPCLIIEDAPRFSWRGFMLDEGRHFHGKETVLRLLDWMALQKLNTFHWHLTEDQGWRLEIQQFPRLTEIGSHRTSTSPSMFDASDGTPHGGFYTQEEIKSIVAYAAERHITVIPEIEIPGHSLAALAAYPELSCTGGPFEVATRFGIFPDIYCAGKESTFTFLTGVLDEVMSLFPSPVIHIGGDEAPKSRWKKCPVCQARMKQEGLKTPHALQGYVTNRIAAYLSAHGRRAMGWNQILHEELDEQAIVHYWVGNQKPVIEAIKNGRDVVMSAFLHTYLDHGYSLTSLRKAYQYDPILPKLDAHAQHILGLEAPLWTEFVPTRARLDYQTFPRLLAFAETGWTLQARKNYPDFQQRLAAFAPRLDELGIQYARGNDLKPNWLKQSLGIFTIIQPQTKTAS